MAIKSDKSIVQMKIRSEVGRILDEYLDEELYRHCYISGDEAWTFKYNYASIAEFHDEIIYSGHVVAKVKKKYAEFVPEKEHQYSFCVRVRGKYELDVVLKGSDEGKF